MSRTRRSRKQDRSRRSKQPWERGRGAKKKGNPRYKPVMVRVKHGKRKGSRIKVYKVRRR